MLEVNERKRKWVAKIINVINVKKNVKLKTRRGGDLNKIQRRR